MHKPGPSSYLMGVLAIALTVVTVAAYPQNVAPKTSTVDKSQDDTILQVRRIAERIRIFRSDEYAVQATIQLASDVCKDDVILGKELFQQALSRFHTAKGDEAGSWRLRLGPIFIERARACDARLAADVVRALAQQDPHQLAVSALRGAGRALLQSSPKAGALAGQVVGRLQFMSPGEIEEFIRLLLNLRDRDPDAADQAFMQALSQVRDLPPDKSVGAMAALANYPFMPQAAAGSPDHERDAIMRFIFGNVESYDISADRPQINTTITTAYLQTAAQVLSGPLGDAETQRAGYALAYQLSSKADRLAPELFPPLALLQRDLSAHAPANAGEVLGRLGQTLQQWADEDMAELDRTVDVKRRQELYVATFAVLWHEKRFTKARDVIRKLEDADLRTELDAIAQFGQAVEALEKSDEERVVALGTSLSPGLKHALLYIGLARQRIRANDPGGASAFLEVALQETQTMERSVKPLLYLTLAAALQHLDEEQALTVLKEWVHSQNDLRSYVAATPPAAAANRKSGVWKINADASGFTESVEVGAMSRRFNLRITGVSGDTIPEILQAFLPENAARVESVVLGLQQEGDLGVALASVAKGYLGRGHNSATRPASHNEK